MLFAAFILYVVVTLVGLLVAMLLPQASGVVLAGTAIFCLIGAVAILYVYKRQPVFKLDRVAQTYLHRLETVVADFSGGRPMETQIKDLVVYLHDKLEFATICLMVRKRNVFVAKESFGLDKDKVRNLKIPSRDRLIQALEGRQMVLSLDRFNSATGPPAPYSGLGLSHVLPVLAGGKCSHLIFLSESEFVPFRMMRPFLMALSDQIGNYRILEEARKNHGQQMAKTKARLKKLDQQVRSQPHKSMFFAKTMVTAQDRLMRIFKRDQLYPTLLDLLQKNFAVRTAAAFAPDDSNQSYVVTHKIGCPGSEKQLPAIRAESNLMGLIDRAARPVDLSSINDSLVHHEELDSLKAVGISHLVPLNDTKMGRVVIGFGRDRKDFTEEELEGIHSLRSLFDLVLANLGHFERIEELSYTDSMTGLYNYRYFYKRLREEVFRARRFSRQLAMVIFDIDGFKVFNDTHGHQAGDFLLEQLGALLLNSVRSIDVVSRYGGEEFCVIMPEAGSDDCKNFMERMRVKILDHEFKDKFTNDQHRITVSLGGAIYPNDAQRVDRLIYCADMALLEAKGSGRNRAFMFDKSFTEKKQVL